MNPRYVRIAERARHHCEYCKAPEAIFNFPFEVEHVVPPGHGGSADDSNLALSCRSCNLFKSNNVTGIDPLSGEVQPLFNPRTNQWQDHLHLDARSARLVGLSPIGEATIEVLHMNS